MVWLSQTLFFYHIGNYIPFSLINFVMIVVVSIKNISIINNFVKNSK